MIPEHDDQNYAGWDDDYVAPFCESCGWNYDLCDLDEYNLCPDCQELDENQEWPDKDD